MLRCGELCPEKVNFSLGASEKQSRTEENKTEWKSVEEKVSEREESINHDLFFITILLKPASPNSKDAAAEQWSWGRKAK